MGWATIPAMAHEPRLTTLLRELLAAHRVAALATVDADGAPGVSMVPFAVDPQQRCLVVHISALAPHTAQLQREPRAALLVAQSETAGEPVHALPRVSVQVLAQTCLLYTSPSPRDVEESRMPSSA